MDRLIVLESADRGNGTHDELLQLAPLRESSGATRSCGFPALDVNTHRDRYYTSSCPFPAKSNEEEEAGAAS